MEDYETGSNWETVKAFGLWVPWVEGFGRLAKTRRGQYTDLGAFAMLTYLCPLLLDMNKTLGFKKIPRW